MARGTSRTNEWHHMAHGFSSHQIEIPLHVAWQEIQSSLLHFSSLLLFLPLISVFVFFFINFECDSPAATRRVDERTVYCRERRRQTMSNKIKLTMSKRKCDMLFVVAHSALPLSSRVALLAFVVFVFIELEMRFHIFLSSARQNGVECFSFSYFIFKHFWCAQSLTQMQTEIHIINL